MQANWDEKYLTHVDIFLMKTWDEKYLTEVRRPTKVRCLTSYRQPLDCFA